MPTHEPVSARPRVPLFTGADARFGPEERSMPGIELTISHEARRTPTLGYSYRYGPLRRCSTGGMVCCRTQGHRPVDAEQPDLPMPDGADDEGWPTAPEAADEPD